MNILGIYGGVTIGQHDPAAALICDGQIIAVCEEERFKRVKSPRGYLPIESVRACLRLGDLTIRDIDVVVHPGETYEGMPERIRAYLTHYFGSSPPVSTVNHQRAHLASAFYCSGFDDAMCLSYDAYGDRLSAALGVGDSSGLRVIETLPKENSLGIFYASMTSYLGFQVGNDESKVMGLAPYGREGVDLSPFASPTDGGYRVNPDYLPENFGFNTQFEPFYSRNLVRLLGPPRMPGRPLTSHHKNVAYATQKTLEACAASLVGRLYDMTGLDRLCVAGGVGLNCAVNAVFRKLPFLRGLFVQPAASDRGLALGCALDEAQRRGELSSACLRHAAMGPGYGSDKIREALDLAGLRYEEVSDPAARCAELLAEGLIVAWHQGRSEFGPRALGSRSILADPRPASMKDKINGKVKFREEFRPFAPSVLEEEAAELLNLSQRSPFMTETVDVLPGGRDRLRAVTHVDGTSRVQTVSRRDLPLFHAMIARFGELTGVPAVLNTSFNVRGQPIVETPYDALATFAATGLDALFMGPFLVSKANDRRPAEGGPT